MEAELEKVRQANKVMIGEIENLKVELHKGIEDIAKALGTGYDRCFERVFAARFDVAGYSFDDYIQDYTAFVNGENLAKSLGRED